jgi:hypothetical protein
MRTASDGAKLAWPRAAPVAAPAIQIANATVCGGDPDHSTLGTLVGSRSRNEAPGAIVGSAKSAIKSPSAGGTDAKVPSPARGIVNKGLMRPRIRLRPDVSQRNRFTARHQRVPSIYPVNGY